MGLNFSVFETNNPAVPGMESREIALVSDRFDIQPICDEEDTMTKEIRHTAALPATPAQVYAALFAWCLRG